jgi:meiotic recombination protein REC8
LPDLLLPPPDLLADLSLPPPFQILRSGESQSLTPFGSQQDSSTSGGQVGGLVFPSSSPRGPGEFRIEGDTGPGSIAGPSGILGDIAEPLLEPDFGFDADGNFIDFADVDAVSGAPAMPPGSIVHSDAAAGSTIRQEHGDGQRASVEVSLLRALT